MKKHGAEFEHGLKPASKHGFNTPEYPEWGQIPKNFQTISYPRN
jgi:hypothetical protein